MNDLGRTYTLVDADKNEQAVFQAIKENKVSIVKVNVDNNSQLAQKYGIRGIPTMIFFKGGNPSKTLVGVQPKIEIVKSLEELA